MNVTFKVETHPEFTVEQLAIQLAGALQGTMSAQEDTTVFQEDIRTQRRKIMDLQLLLTQIKAFRDNPPAKISRMEPLMQYDKKAIQKEIVEITETIESLEKIVQKSKDQVVSCQKDTLRLQQELSQRNSSA